MNDTQFNTFTLDECVAMSHLIQQCRNKVEPFSFIQVLYERHYIDNFDELEHLINALKN